MTKDLSAESIMRSTWEKVRDMTDEQLMDLLKNVAADDIDLQVGVHRLREWANTGFLPDIPQSKYRM